MLYFSPLDAETGAVLEARSLLDSSGSDIQGWSFGVSHDPALLGFPDVENGTTTATVNNGSPPEFVEYSLFSGGWTMGVLISFTGGAVLGPGLGYDLAVATYEVFGDVGASTELCYCACLGMPPVSVVVVVGGASITPDQYCGLLVIEEKPFIRGDINADGGFNIADAIYLLDELFAMGPPSLCDRASDANDDGGKNISDAIYVLANLFSMGPNPPAPFPGCGIDPTPDGFTCASFPPCP